MIHVRRSLPPSGEAVTRVMADGHALRTIAWPAGPRGSILFINGRGDFIEKYAESYAHWIGAGFGLAVFDWRGQGLSGRVGATHDHGHSTGFDRLVADLGEQVAWFRTALPPPHHAVAHSMGGHLLLRHLSVAPESFDRAVLLAPLMGLVAAPLGPRAARWLARVMVAAGRGGAYVPGAGPYAAHRPGRAGLLTGDAERFGDEAWWVAQNAALRLGGVTWGWLDAAFRSLDALAARLSRVTTPLLILTAANDRLVDSSAAMRIGRTLPSATVERIDDAAHELLRERDAIRDAVLARIDGFLG